LKTRRNQPMPLYKKTTAATICAATGGECSQPPEPKRINRLLLSITQSEQAQLSFLVCFSFLAWFNPLPL
jgi:hypothetical protein